MRGLEVIHIDGGMPCCGMSGGLDRRNEEFAVAMANVVFEKTRLADADLIIGNDYNCLMHLEGVIKKQNLPFRCEHIAAVLTSGWD